jgi:hypothetical protein
VLIPSQRFRDLVHANAPLGDLRRQALADGMIPLHQNTAEVTQNA